MFDLIIHSFKLFKIAYLNNRKVLKYTAIVVMLEILSVAFLYKLNGVYGNLYQAIQEYRPSDIWNAIWTFCGLAGVLVVVNGYMGAFINRLAFEIREGLTSHCFSHLEVISVQSQYAQRIQEDLRKFGESSCDFWSGIFKAVIKLPIFLGVVVSLTHWYTGLFIFLAVIVGTVATRLVSKRLVGLQAEQESNEALFRSTLVERKAYDIAFFSLIRPLFLKINSRLKLLSFTQSGLGQTFVLLPFIVLMPLYIAKTITMGGFFQSVNALSKIIDSLVILIDSRQVIVNIESSITRLQFLIKK